MRTTLPTELSALKSCQHLVGTLIRRVVWLTLIHLIVAAISHGPQFTTYNTSQVEPKLTPRSRVSLGSIVAPTISRRYDCSGGLEVDFPSGRALVDQAIDDALEWLEKCEPCRRMFNSEDPTYGAALLRRLKRNKVFVISEKIPRRWILSSDDKKLTVLEAEEFGSAGAKVQDLFGPTQGEMRKPCIYVNRRAFIATGDVAENFALYKLPPPVQRATAILHELGHVAGILQYDGDDEKEPENKKRSGQNTNCIRLNCISCKSATCPNAPVQRTKRRRSPATRS